jgi:hypothetical protein
MPYITHGNRAALDVIIDGLVKRLKDINCKKGDVNYAITRVVLEALNKDDYHSLSDCVSVLRDAADEIQRRLLGPYEDKAVLRNGDMLCFQKDYSHRPLGKREYPEKTECCGKCKSVKEVAGDLAEKLEKQRNEGV